MFGIRSQIRNKYQILTDEALIKQLELIQEKIDTLESDIRETQRESSHGDRADVASAMMLLSQQRSLFKSYKEEYHDLKSELERRDLQPEVPNI